MIGRGDNSPCFTICPFCKRDLTSITVGDIIHTDTGLELTEVCKRRLDVNISADYLGTNPHGNNINDFDVHDSWNQKNQLDYFKELKKLREMHPLKTIKAPSDCLHNQCTICHGTGLKEDGSTCLHGISCPCPKCNPILTSKDKKEANK